MFLIVLLAVSYEMILVKVFAISLEIVLVAL